METTQFSIETFDVEKFDAILARGLSYGVGQQNGQMCIEAAICSALGLPHGDDPKCVAESVRSFKIALNDKNWSSPTARAAGLRDLGLAQLGSLGIINDKEFCTLLSKSIIQNLLPVLIRELYPKNQKFLTLAQVCEDTGSRESALNLRDTSASASAAYAAYAAANAAANTSASAAYAAYAAYAAASAAYAAAYAAASAANAGDKYLILAAKLALDVLRELKSPGCELLSK